MTDKDYFIIIMMKANFDSMYFFIKCPKPWQLGQFVGGGGVGGVGWCSAK